MSRDEALFRTSREARRAIARNQMCREDGDAALQCQGAFNEDSVNFRFRHDYSEIGRSPAGSVQGARDDQKTWRVGPSCGSASKVPLGTMTARPLRVAWGSG